MNILLKDLQLDEVVIIRTVKFWFDSAPAFLGSANQMTTYIPVHKNDIQAIDQLVKIGRGRQTITSDSDWMVVAKIFEFWTRRWPQEWQEFGSTIKDIRETRLNKQGMSESGDTKYVGALPLRLMKIIQIIFPLQQFNKKFVNNLVKRIKIIKVGERNDSWFVI